VDKRKTKIKGGDIMRNLKRIIGIMVVCSLIAIPSAFGIDFSGKTVNWSVPFGVGGGTDVWTRLYAPYFQKYLPGSPIVAVKNKPGGGGIVGGNYFAKRAKPHGLDVFSSSGSITLPFLLNNPKVKYDFSKFSMVLSSPVGGVIYVNPNLGIKSISDLKGHSKQMIYAAQAATSVDIVPLLSFEILGLNVKPVFGYKGRGPGRVAFEQGESTIDHQASPAYKKNVIPLVKQGLAVPLYSWGIFGTDGKIVRDPEEPNLPTLREAYISTWGKEPSGPAWNAWKAFYAVGFQKGMWLPEKTPDGILNVYTQAAKKVIADPEFIKSAEVRLGKYPQMVGPEARKTFNKLIQISKEDREWLINWLKTKYDVSL
jgi:tripartite-type tricarboxylate transporter receptor subunit TctC